MAGVTSGKTITIAATLISKVLKNTTDYANWIKIAKACEQSATLWGGYFRLGANITATSMVMFNRGATDGSEGFKGVFDGCGYVIDGLNRNSWDSNAFVTTMTETGVLKNIAFTNAKITGAGNFLTSGGKGTIENVYVQYTEISAGSQTMEPLPISMAVALCVTYLLTQVKQLSSETGQRSEF